MAREPYDYQTERRISALVLGGLIVFLSVADALLAEFAVDPANLALLIGALLAVLGLGPLLRRLR